MPRKKVLTVAAAILILAGVVIISIVVALKSTSDSSEPVSVEKPEAESTTPIRREIGRSVEGRSIEAYTYGTGPTNLLFVGGIHGGYEWNSVLLAYEAMDHFAANPDGIPDNISVTIVPAANPDGIYDVIGKEGRFSVEDVAANAAFATLGRFNANSVDLNRNFDCKWQPESTWRGNIVSAGTAPFSEPEAQALRNLINSDAPDAVVFWHSQANAVYASECEAGILSGTRTVMNTYASAAQYPAVETFDAYPVTGDAEGWLASIGIPAITVELATHEAVEWERNLLGIQALIDLYDAAE